MNINKRFRRNGGGENEAQCNNKRKRPTTLPLNWAENCFDFDSVGNFEKTMPTRTFASENFRRIFETSADESPPTAKRAKLEAKEEQNCDETLCNSPLKLINFMPNFKNDESKRVGQDGIGRTVVEQEEKFVGCKEEKEKSDSDCDYDGKQNGNCQPPAAEENIFVGLMGPTAEEMLNNLKNGVCAFAKFLAEFSLLGNKSFVLRIQMILNNFSTNF